MIPASYPDRKMPLNRNYFFVAATSRRTIKIPWISLWPPTLIFAAFRKVDIKVIINAPTQTAIILDLPPAALVPPTKQAAMEGRK